MRPLINLRQIERRDLPLKGELSAEELDMVALDELVRLAGPVSYDVVAQRMEGGILVRGKVEVPLGLECSRCLKPFEKRLALEDWACHLALTGEETPEIHDDCVDLTPYLREDILLELPQHPLCKPDCGGLPQKAVNRTEKSEPRPGEQKASAWDALNKLKL